MNKIIRTDDWILRAEISRIETPPDYFQLNLTSQLLTAKNPAERVKMFGATFSRDQLTSFRDVIDLHLATFVPVEVEGYPV